MKINLKLLFLSNILVFLSLLSNLSIAQSNSPDTDSQIGRSLRQIVYLDSDWQMKPEKSDDNWQKINIPFIHSSNESIILRRKFRIPKYGNPNIYSITFENVVNLDEVYINENRLSFDPSELPLQTFDFSSKLIRDDSENTIRLVLTNKSRSKHNRILASKILFPEKNTGLFKPPFITVYPSSFIGEVNFLTDVDLVNPRGILNYDISIINNQNGSNIDLENFLIEISVYDESQLSKISSEKLFFDLKDKNQYSIHGKINIANPNLWSPETPVRYIVKTLLFHNNMPIDENSQYVGFREIKLSKNKFLLNGYHYDLKGITYFAENQFSFFESKVSRDLNLAKDLGANAIRVLNSVPSKEFVEECDRLGFLLFVDIESKIYTESFYDSEKNRLSIKQIITHLHNLHSGSPSIVALNFGFANSKLQLENLIELVKFSQTKNPSILNFYTTDKIIDIDDERFSFIGFETYKLKLSEIQSTISKLKENNKNFLISSIGYSHSYKVNDGYSDPYSEQAQAKYLAGYFETLQKDSIPFFVNTLFDYRLPYHSVIAGSVDNKLFSLGLINEYRNKQKLSYKVVESYFKNEKLPIIVQGNFSDDQNVIFVFTGIGLIVMLVLLINSTRRFREYTTRALLKTYNFFSDIRDERVISTFQTTLLAIIVTTSIALLHSGVLFYFKDKIIFEKFISLFNSEPMFEFISYLAWRPFATIFYGSIFFFALILLTTLLVKFFNLFVRSKIFLSHAYSLTVWSVFPFVISLPLGIVAYKVLQFQEYNIVVFGLILIFHLWILSRLLKGISILFEVRKLNVNFSFIIFFAALISGLFIYFEFTALFWEYFNLYFIN
ncbi:MAG: hypothetical protein FJ213_07360 [Ignavibacteria bacterium]|nr:hypothetical protein [Ignavibacteria bacterium]